MTKMSKVKKTTVSNRTITVDAGNMDPTKLRKLRALLKGMTLNDWEFRLPAGLNPHLYLRTVRATV